MFWLVFCDDIKSSPLKLAKTKAGLFLALKTVRAYLIYLKNIMEITLQKGLEPVNAAKDRKCYCPLQTEKPYEQHG
jgi:hypothetical protein